MTFDDDPEAAAAPVSAVVRPRVLIVCPVGEEVGGAEQVMLALARELPHHGFDAVIAVMRPGRVVELAKKQGIEAYAFPHAHKFRDVVTVGKAIRWLQKLAIEVDACLLLSSHTAHMYGGLAARLARIPEVWELFDVVTQRDPVERLSIRIKPSHTIFTGVPVSSGYPELHQGPHSFVPPSCIDQGFLSGQPPRPDVCARFNLPAGPTLLTVTRLQKHKGHSVLIEAAGEVLQKQPDATFLIVGAARGPEQEQYRTELVQLSERLGIADRVRFLGFVDDADLAELYRRGTAMVHPALSEGYGLVLLEAMGMGLPVVAAAATGPSEIIQDGENGLLVPVGDASALAAATLRLLEDEQLRDRLKLGGKRTAEHLTLNDMVARTAEVFRKTLAAQRRA